ncbi:DUF2934 domain-containing protein [Rhizobium rhizogenes]|uniref:DUF2934 domain-containing protein n=1 Tax=Rhizobium rhizogenes TaxID=359 RepID=UPI0015735BB8|nr:DUF2934 domain-containing protein [Rhizobium rhizogenes]NTI32885.1 DUF2934 domain-containing protein [Rhizobium rhizogenes]
MQDPREDKIRLRAYQIWEDEGRPEGEELAHWYRADGEFQPDENPMQANQPSMVEETESATQAVEVPRTPPVLTTSRRNASRRKQVSPSDAPAESSEDAASSGG